jgi:hypothetical protein
VSSTEAALRFLDKHGLEGRKHGSQLRAHKKRVTLEVTLGTNTAVVPFVPGPLASPPRVVTHNTMLTGRMAASFKGEEK